VSIDARVRAVRGAITVPADDPERILDATRTLLEEMMLLNSLGAEQLVSVIFTATPDLTAAFPARAARELGWNDVPLLCMTEMAVPGSLPRCVRVLMHAELPAGAGRGRHVYLGGAAELRPDLASSASSASPASPAEAGSHTVVIPARAGIHVRSRNLDPRLRGDDDGMGPRSSDDGGILCEDGERCGSASDSALTSARLETLDEL
jgi:chorismate mutase